MDMTIIIAVAILAVMVTAEILCIVHNGGKKLKSPDFVAVIPVFPNDDSFSERLYSISEKITRGSLRADAIFLVDYGADSEKTELCRQFCRENAYAETVLPENLEKMLSKTFAIDKEI